MQVYKAPIQDMMFCLETMGYDRVRTIDRYEPFDIETIRALSEEAGKMCTEQLLPLNRPGDEQGVSFDPATGSVTTPEGFDRAYKMLLESGMMGIAHDEAYGGGGAPNVMHTILNEMVTATNKSFSMCPGLSHGLIEALHHYGDKEIKDRYLAKLISGEWTGTMCLTEPQCGTDLGLMRSKATPHEDHYLVSGTKIWISFGEHDLAENIIHLVLARLPDAPKGIKGISAFIVPKFNPDGSRNGIMCTGLEHKMGIHASPTCVMSMENARAWLVGEPHRGMRTMFVMMNSARLGVGLEGVALGEIAYQTAVEYAKDRRQSRSLDPAKQDHTAAADNILVHPDVRRMLANVRVTTEALRGLGTWIANLADVEEHHQDEKVREEASALVALLTPIMKSYGTERGFQNVSEAMQVCGGAGYTTDWSIEQYMRDLRIALIYEGTNHIQALDLVGRKIPAKGGRSVQYFAGKMMALLKEVGDNEVLAPYAKELQEGLAQLNDVVRKTLGIAMKDAEIVGATASNILNLFALNALGYVWLRQAAFASSKSGKFYEMKMKSANYYFKMIYPERHGYAAIISEGKAAINAFEPDDF